MILFSGSDEFEKSSKTFSLCLWQVNQFTLTNLHPGIRYRVKLAPLMNNGKLRGAYSSWVNARTLEGDKLKNIYFFPTKLWIAIGWNESLLYHVQPKYYIKFNGKWTRFQPLRIPFDILSCGLTKRLVIGHYHDTRVSPCRCWLHCVEKWLARDTLRWFLILLVRCPIKNSPYFIAEVGQKSSETTFSLRNSSQHRFVLMLTYHNRQCYCKNYKVFSKILDFLESGLLFL